MTQAPEQTRIETAPKWIRGYRAGEKVIDSRGVKLVWTHPYYPTWFFPVNDVAADLVTSEAASSRPETELVDHVAIRWDSVDKWFEEDVEVYVHPRDPHKRVDALTSSRHVVVSIDGVVVANSHKPTILYETGLPPRYYVSPTDVRLDLLTPTDTSTACPYKGWASYWTATIDGVDHPDIVWSYATPLPESEAVAGLMCFYNEKVDIEIDGLDQDRPVTQFS